MIKNCLLVAFSVFIVFAMGGFNLDNAIVPREEIVSGGPPRDGIPAILNPKFEPAASIEYLAPEDDVIALQIGEEIKAYPINILTWHEIVNDTVGGTPVAVTF